MRHVLASSAIPIFFPAVDIDGDWYADGSIRLTTPLSPAIRMGAGRIVAIAVRYGAPTPPDRPVRREYPSSAETAGALLDALMLDALESDVERARRINETLAFVPPEIREKQVMPLRAVAVLVLRPSRDPGSLVLGTLDRFPAAIRQMFRGLGASATTGWDLLSYFAFDHAYTTRLVNLGYEDALARSREILEFLA